MIKPAIALATLFSTASSFAALVSVPYSTNFDSSVVGSDAEFTETVGTAGLGTSNTAVGSVQPITPGSSDNVYRIGVSAVGGTPSGGTQNAANLSSAVNASGTTGSGNGFLVSTTFVLDGTTGSNGTTNISLVAASASGAFSSATGYRLTFTIFSNSAVGTNNAPGGLQISEIGGGAIGTITYTSGTSNLAITAGATYTISLQGIYNSSGGINLFASVTDGTSTRSLSVADTSALQGTYFGTRTAVASGSASNPTSLDLSMTDFSLSAVPEPSSVTLLAGCLGLAAFVRRRAH